jgi:hypothetical protein
MTILYTLNVTDPVTSCSAEDVVLANVSGTPLVTLSNDTTICAGNPVTLIANGGTFYTWSSGQTTNVITENPMVTTAYVVTVSDGTCATADTVTVFVSEPNVDLGQDIAVFSSQAVVLDAGAGFNSYLWSTGATTQTIIVDTTNIGIGTFIYSVVVVDSTGCQGYDDIEITFVSVGIDEQDASVSIIIQPNPNNGYFELILKGLDSKVAYLQIMNITGQIVHQQKVDNLVESAHSFNFGYLPKGIYTLRVQTGEITINKKLVIK